MAFTYEDVVLGDARAMNTDVCFILRTKTYSEAFSDAPTEVYPIVKTIFGAT
jgi:hypothetical protein